MKAYVLLLVMMLKSITCQKDSSLHVGTVLFSPLDTKRSQWSKTEVSLLRARRYFQKLLPPPNINTSIDNYINTLLNYIKEAYTTVKREAVDPISDSIMTTALSDAFGGYLKAWILPITKYGYYAGIISQNNALKLFHFYDQIKSYMETDGKGWNNPDCNILSSIDIVIPQYHSKTRNVNDACQKIAYLEKTKSGLRVPIPYINWDKNTQTMFVPFKNQSLISLQSPDSSNVLFQYYDLARRCLREIDTADEYDFEHRLQSWLSEDVVPHLNDDELYLALNSVLTLMNNSQNLCETIKSDNKPFLSYIPINFTSKKIIIVIIILFLEIAWFIPALLYLTICSKKKKKSSLSNVFLFLDSHDNKKEIFSDTCYSKLNDTNKGNVYHNRKPRQDTIRHYTSDTYPDCKGFKIEQKSHLRPIQDKNLFPESTLSKYSVGTITCPRVSSKICSADIVTVVKETKVGTTKSSLKSIFTRQNIIQSSDQSQLNFPKISGSKSNYTKLDQSKSNQSSRYKSADEILCDCNCTPDNSITNDSLITVQELEPRKTFTLVKNMKTSKQTLLCIPQSNALPIECHQVKSFAECNQIQEKQDKDLTKQPCLSYINEKKCKNNVNETQSQGKQISHVNISLETMPIRNEKETSTKIEKCTKPNLPKKSRHSNKLQGLKLSSGNPFLEIKIDRPHTEMSVGIGGACLSKNTKASRIPKKTVNDNVVRLSYKILQEKSTASTKQRSMIPQLKKRPVDDNVVTCTKTSSHNRLNETL
ncbi:uncharacterized protein LOC113510778 [Galleria mellonella]|uniref:Uncharacterized protein LOC113510778 n=1 Tax=Galleria mellonella TaxID=7137 RepID=A0ABM3N4M3_GALME|nr:uncharacterized protein LOC113510778 [Galleria mellonella]